MNNKISYLFNFRGFALLDYSTLIPWEAKFVTKLYSKKYQGQTES